jgi:hypothetical protein
MSESPQYGLYCITGSGVQMVCRKLCVDTRLKTDLVAKCR